MCNLCYLLIVSRSDSVVEALVYLCVYMCEVFSKKCTKVLFVSLCNLHLLKNTSPTNVRAFSRQLVALSVFPSIFDVVNLIFQVNFCILSSAAVDATQLI